MTQKPLELPASVDAERAILGGILLRNELYSEMAAQLSPDDFYLASHQVLFAVMGKIDGPIDFITVAEELKRRNCLDSMGGPVYLSSLTDGVPALGNLDHYAKIIREKRALRQIAHIGGGLSNRAVRAEDEAEQITAEVQRELATLSVGKGRGFVRFVDLFKQHFNSIDAIHEQWKSARGLETGYHKLDAMTYGLQESELILLAARPSMGKTALALNIAVNVAKGGGVVGVFSLEMSSRALLLRMIGAESRVGAMQVRYGSMGREEGGRLTTATANLCESNIFLDDQPQQRPETMIARAKALKARYGLALVIVDYLQLMSVGGRESRMQEISYVSRCMKEMAREVQAPVIAVSQLSRAIEERQGEPRLSDLRESGQLEQDADVVIFLWKEEKTAGKVHPSRVAEVGEAQAVDTKRQNTVKVSIAKQRNGPTGIFELEFIRQHTRFYNPSNQPDDRQESFAI